MAKKEVRKNIEMGFWSGGAFHPIRASVDYNEEVAGEKQTSAYHLAQSGKLLKMSKTAKARLQNSMATKQTTATATQPKTQNGFITQQVMKAIAEKAAKSLLAKANRLNAKTSKPKKKNPTEETTFSHKLTRQELNAKVKKQLETSRYVVSSYLKKGNGFVLNLKTFHTKTESNLYANSLKKSGRESVRIHTKTAKKRNGMSFEQLTELYETFLGVKPTGTKDIQLSVDFPLTLAVLSESVPALVLMRNGEQFNVKFNPQPRLATDGTNFYLLGIDNETKKMLKDFFGTNSKSLQIDYDAVKRHLTGSRLIQWFHYFGEINGNRPKLAFMQDGTPKICGGKNLFLLTERGIEN